MLKNIANILSKITIMLFMFTIVIYIIKIIFCPIEVYVNYGFVSEDFMDKIVKWDSFFDFLGFKKINITQTYNVEETTKYKNMIQPNNLTEQFIFIVGRSPVFIDLNSENAELEFKKAVCENNLLLPRCFT